MRCGILVALMGVVGAHSSSAIAPDEVQFLLHCPGSALSFVEQLLPYEDFKTVREDDGTERLLVFASELDLQQLRKHEFDCVVVETAQPLRQKLNLTTTENAALPDGYSDLEAIYNFLIDIEERFPTIARLADMSRYPPGRTINGHFIPVIKLSDNVDVEEDEPQMLVISAHHAREIVTPQVAMDLITLLVEGYGKDELITNAVNGYEIFIGPIWNPDGYEHVWNSNNMWRKNRRPNGGNVFGVDQNRNYPFGWTSTCAGSTNPSSDVYKGPSAASEAETQTVMNFAAARRFAKVLDFHSYGREVLYGQRCNTIPPLVAQFNRAEATALGALSNYVVRLPSGDGQHQGWHMTQYTAYSFLIETETEFQPSFARARAEFNRLLPLIRTVLSRPIPLVGHVFDLSGNPVVASIQVEGWTSPNAPRSSEPRFGRYHLWLPTGQHRVRFSARGYLTHDASVSITQGSTVVRNVYLQLGDGPEALAGAVAAIE